MNGGEDLRRVSIRNSKKRSRHSCPASLCKNGGCRDISIMSFGQFALGHPGFAGCLID
jgi:hypothetical protein